MKIWAGIDPGEKRCGLARSDPLGITAQPKRIVRGYDELAATLREWDAESHLGGVVVGLPLNMDGSIGPLARRSLELARKLRGDLPFPVVLWDERLSTRALERLDGGHAKRRGEPLDHRAAALILQSFLDAGAPLRPDPIDPAGGE